MSRWAVYLLDRAARRPPSDGCAVPGSTPVVSFGDPLQPEVATLGINPSSAEFLDREKRLLTGPKRRLATLESLGLRTYDGIDYAAAAQIVTDCFAYFSRRPYRWFDTLDDILTSALSVSYRNGTASHLDLVQWATDPIWKHLPEAVRARLLSEDRDFLIEQLRREGYRLIVVAGRTAMSWVQQAGLVRWRQFAELEGSPAATFFTGDTESPTFVGWSCNLQSQPGARQHIPRLIEILGLSGSVPQGQAYLDHGDLVPRATHFRSRSDLVSYLEEWLTRSKTPTIGDVSRFAQAPWISFESSVGLVDLNADTKREAVERMVEHVRSMGTDPWYVVANRRGRVNKVVFSRDDSAAGWYAYLRAPLAKPQRIGEEA